ncbi:MAG: hypothetical protein BJ554DRAFT_6545 [Olpidium bornovanus]|uniref:Uncharacterized protein n=1 Tax=Olpidium bornovanus TaxID=278681 RepID=A0A8H7ZY22_9FUNG|nr:MAG: hypothetical protein BJ554DRAFT_6545 [Olpidium bornovanus]
MDRILLQSNQMKRKNAEFVRLLNVRENLPSFFFKQNIVDCIMKNQVTIVSGETGW